MSALRAREPRTAPAVPPPAAPPVASLARRASLEMRLRLRIDRLTDERDALAVKLSRVAIPSRRRPTCPWCGRSMKAAAKACGQHRDLDALLLGDAA